MSSPQIVGVFSNHTPNTRSVEVSLSGVQVGDLLLALVTAWAPINAIAGMTQLFAIQRNSWNRASGFYQIATDSVSGYTVTTAQQQYPGIAVTVLVIRGFHGVPEAETWVAPSRDVAPEAPPLTPSWGAGHTLWLAGATEFSEDTMGTTGESAPADYGIVESYFFIDRDGDFVRLITTSREFEASSQTPGVFSPFSGANVSDVMAWTIGVQAAPPPDIITGSGALPASVASVAGVAQRGVSGTGALPAGPASASGVAARHVEGAVSLSATPGALVASAKRVHRVVAALAAHSAAVAMQVEWYARAGTAVLTARTGTVSATARRVVKGSGELAGGAPRLRVVSWGLLRPRPSVWVGGVPSGGNWAEQHPTNEQWRES